MGRAMIPRFFMNGMKLGALDKELKAVHQIGQVILETAAIGDRR